MNTDETPVPVPPEWEHKNFWGRAMRTSKGVVLPQKGRYGRVVGFGMPMKRLAFIVPLIIFAGIFGWVMLQNLSESVNTSIMSLLWGEQHFLSSNTDHAVLADARLKAFIYGGMPLLFMIALLASGSWRYYWTKQWLTQNPGMTTESELVFWRATSADSKDFKGAKPRHRKEGPAK